MSDAPQYSALEHVFRYGDIASINTTTQNRIKGINIWKERLETEGFYYTHSHILNLSYRDVYESLKRQNFEVDKAYLFACSRNDEFTVQYLSHYVDKKLHKLCIRNTKSKEIIRTQDVNENMDDILIESLGDVRKLKYLLEHYSPKNIIPIVLTTAVRKAQIVVLKHLTLQDIRPYLDLIQYEEIGKLVENMDYRFNIHRSIDLDLVRSTRTWIRNKPSQAAVVDAIRYALESLETLAQTRRGEEVILPEENFGKIKVLKLVFFMSNKKYLEGVMKRASTSGLFEVCVVLASMGIDTNETIVQAIRDNKITMCQTLLKYTTQSHLKLAGTLRRVEIYNMFLRHMSA